MKDGLSMQDWQPEFHESLKDWEVNEAGEGYQNMESTW
jgi:hypothetical protein